MGIVGCLCEHLRKGHEGPQRHAHCRKAMPSLGRGGPRKEMPGPGLLGGYFGQGDRNSLRPAPLVVEPNGAGGQEERALDPLAPHTQQRKALWSSVTFATGNQPACQLQPTSAVLEAPVLPDLCPTSPAKSHLPFQTWLKCYFPIPSPSVLTSLL